MLKEILLSSSILASSLIGGSPVYTNQELNEKINEQFPYDDIFVNVGNWFCGDFALDETFLDDDDNFYVTYIASYYTESFNSGTENMFLLDCFLTVCFSGNKVLYDLSYCDYYLNYMLISPTERVYLDAIPFGSYVSVEYLTTPNSNDFEAFIEVDVDGDIKRSSSLVYQNVVDDDRFEPTSSTDFTTVISDYISTFENLLNENYEETQGIFGIIGDSVIAYISSIGAMFTSIMSIFYYEEKLTFIGILLLIGFSIGIVKWAFNLVKRLVRK